MKTRICLGKEDAEQIQELGIVPVVFDEADDEVEVQCLRLVAQADVVAKEILNEFDLANIDVDGID